MALATGSQHMNILAAASGASLAADGATDGGGSDSAERIDEPHPFLLAPADAAKFVTGSIVALDVDYTGQTGYVGAPVVGAYVRQALEAMWITSGGSHSMLHWSRKWPQPA